MKKINRTNSLAKNTFLLGINRVVSPLISFLLIPIYTNNISSHEYGITDLIQTYIALIVPILIMRLDVGMFRLLVERRGNKNAVSEVATNVIALVAPPTIASTLIMAFAIMFNILPFQVATLFYFLNIMISNIVTPLVRGLGKNFLYAASSIVGIISNLIFSSIFVLVFHMGGFGLILSLGLSCLVSNIICLVGIRTQISLNRQLLNKNLRRELVKLSAPIIADGISFWVVNASDRTIVSAFVGMTANGVYAISNKFSNLISMITTTFWMSWSEQASIAVNDKDYSKFVSKVFDTYLRILSSISVLLIAAMPMLFSLLVNDSYIEATVYIPALIIGLLLSSIGAFYSPVYLAFKKSKEVALSTTIAAVINLAVDLLLVGSMGIWAAVISTIIAYAFILVYRYIDIKKLVKIRYNIRNIVFIIIWMTVSVVVYYIGNQIVIYSNLLLALAISAAMNRKIVNKVIEPIIKRIKSIKIAKNSCCK